MIACYLHEAIGREGDERIRHLGETLPLALFELWVLFEKTILYLLVVWLTPVSPDKQVQPSANERVDYPPDGLFGGKPRVA